MNRVTSFFVIFAFPVELDNLEYRMGTQLHMILYGTWLKMINFTFLKQMCIENLNFFCLVLFVSCVHSSVESVLQLLVRINFPTYQISLYLYIVLK